MGTDIRYPLLVMKSGANQVSLGRPGSTLAGWLSGTLASLASNAPVTVVFDMGLEWAQYGLMQLTITGTQALASIVASGSDLGTVADQPLPGGNSDGSLLMELTEAGAVQATTRVVSRYVMVAITNGALAQAAGANVRLVAYPS